MIGKRMIHYTLFRGEEFHLSKIHVIIGPPSEWKSGLVQEIEKVCGIPVWGSIEYGLHPVQIKTRVNQIRLYESQIVLLTDSPLVLNCFAPEEVTLVTPIKGPDGKHSRLMKDTPNFEQRAKVYMLGELWLAYADGILDCARGPTGPDP